MKRTIIIDTDNDTVELLQDGYNIIERTVYDDEIVAKAKELLSEVLGDEQDDFDTSCAIASLPEY